MIGSIRQLVTTEMTAVLLTQICIALIVFVLLLVIQGKSLFRQRAFLTLFFAVFFIDNLLIVMTNRYNNLQLIPNTIWEGFLVCCWSGKLYSILAMALLLYILRTVLTKTEVGLTLRHNPGSVLLACIVILLLAGWSLWIGISSPKGKLDFTTLLYLAIMPGLNEELVYRGVLFAILVKIIPGSKRFSLSNFGWGILTTSLLFGLLHGFWIDNNHSVHIDWIALQNTTISGFIFAWLRATTGSLLLPVVAHGVEDFLFFLPRMF